MEYRVLTIKVDVVEASTEKEAKEKAEVEDIIYSCSTLALIEKSDSDDMFDTADYMLDMAEETIKSRYDTCKNTGDISPVEQ